MKTKTLKYLFELRDDSQRCYRNYDGFWEGIRDLDFSKLPAKQKYKIRDQIQFLISQQWRLTNQVTDIITEECGTSCEDHKVDRQLPQLEIEPQYNQ